MEEMKPTLKLMTKQDFDVVKNKYHSDSAVAKKAIEEAKPLDVLALQVIPGSGLKILDAKIFNEDKEEVFLKSLREGVF